MRKINLNFYLKRYIPQIIFYCIFIFLGALGSIITVILGAQVISYITVANFALGFRFSFYYLIAIVARSACWYISNILYYKYANQIGAEISLDLTKRCFELSSSTFSENNTGSFVQKIINEPKTVLENLSEIVDSISTIISGLVVICYIYSLNWIIGLIFSLVLIGLVNLEAVRQKVRKKKQLNRKRIEDQTTSLVTEIIKSEKDIKALSLDNKLLDVANNNLNKRKKSELDYQLTDNSFWSARNVLIQIFSGLIFILGIRFLQQNIITLSAVILLYSYKEDIYSLVWSWGRISQSITDIKVSNQRMFGLFDTDLYEIDRFGNIDIEDINGEIEFKNVKYSYTELVENKGKKNKIKVERIKQQPIFNDLSFKITPNSTVAFVGKSGSGKSTILSLITKLFVVDSGEIKIDGFNINDLTKQSLRKNISLINQSPYIFDMSIKDNLLLAKKDATDEELWEALNQACFDQDVKKMPKGIDSVVGETGIKLSGGQRQRLAIARALLKNSKIILFDESTSSLDNFAQSHIQTSIENMKGKHTIIIVAHRLSTIKNVDKIYFLSNGEIIDSGTFNELFENNQQFRNMFLIENLNDKD